MKSPASPNRLETFGAAALLVVLVLIAYYPAFDAGFVMDDDLYVTEQPVNRSLEGLARIWLEPAATPQYYPLTHTAFWIQYQLWGAKPDGYHAVNIALHAIVVLLAWRLLLRLEVPWAWLAAAIFAVHPVCVESVAWTTKLMNTQSLALALGSMLIYLRRGGWPAWALSLALFALALLSKSVVATMPAVLLVIAWWKRGTITWRDVAPLLPFFVLGITAGLLTSHLERGQVGAQGPEWSLSLVDRCLVAGRAVCFYAGKLVWPYPLLFYYPRWNVDAAQWWQYLYPAGVLAVLAILWALRRRIGRGPLAAALIYVGVLFPALGFFNVFAFRYSFVADHWQYHAMLAPIALAAGTLALWRNRQQAVVFAGVILVAFTLLSWNQSSLYASRLKLYETTLARNPDSWLGHNNLGQVFREGGKFGEAIAEYRKSIELNPDIAATHANLAAVQYQLGNRREAIEQYEIAARLTPQNYIYQLDLANLLSDEGRHRDAIEHYRRAIEARADWYPPWRELAIAYAAVDQSADALDAAAKALQLAENAHQAQAAREIRTWIEEYGAHLDATKGPPQP